MKKTLTSFLELVIILVIAGTITMIASAFVTCAHGGEITPTRALVNTDSIICKDTGTLNKLVYLLVVEDDQKAALIYLRRQILLGQCMTVDKGQMVTVYSTRGGYVTVRPKGSPDIYTGIKDVFTKLKTF
jgi:hypothetical protein